MQTYRPQKSFFGKNVSAINVAKEELTDLNLRLMHYNNEVLLAQSQVSYLEGRKAQLQEQVRNGYFDESLGVVKSSPETYQDIEFGKQHAN